MENQNCFSYIDIVSNWKLEEQYKDIKREYPETYEAFLRRIKKVRVYKDSGVYEDYDTQEYLYGFKKISGGGTPFDE